MKADARNVQWSRSRNKLNSRQIVQQTHCTAENIADKFYSKQHSRHIVWQTRLTYSDCSYANLLHANETIVLVHFKLPKKSNQQIVTAFLSLKHSPRLLMFCKNRPPQITYIYVVTMFHEQISCSFHKNGQFSLLVYSKLFQRRNKIECQDISFGSYLTKKLQKVAVNKIDIQQTVRQATITCNKIRCIDGDLDQVAENLQKQLRN